MDPADEDTIEMELSPEQLRVLAEAAAGSMEPEDVPVPVPVLAPPVVAKPNVVVARAREPTPIVVVPPLVEPVRTTSSVPPLDAYSKALVPASRGPTSARAHGANLASLIGMTAIASVALASVGYLSRSATSPLMRPARQATPIVRPSSVPAPQPGAAEPPPPVRYTNPFDANEVFEFPPGTSEQAAHDAVAALLLERARLRHGAQPVERVTSTSTPRHR